MINVEEFINKLGVGPLFTLILTVFLFGCGWGLSIQATQAKHSAQIIDLQSQTQANQLAQTQALAAINSKLDTLLISHFDKK